MAVDWQSMEKDWREGIKPVLQLSKEYAVSRAAILKHWAKESVERDLTAKIKAKAEAMVTQAVTRLVTPEAKITEKAIVTANAEQVAMVALSQRKDIKRNRELATKLMAELEATTDNLGLFEQLGELLASPDEKGMDKLGEIYRKVMSLPSRIKAVKELADTLRILIELERKVYKMEDVPSENPLADFIKRISGNTIQPVIINGDYSEVDGE